MTTTPATRYSQQPAQLSCCGIATATRMCCRRSTATPLRGNLAWHLSGRSPRAAWSQCGAINAVDTMAHGQLPLAASQRREPRPSHPLPPLGRHHCPYPCPCPCPCPERFACRPLGRRFLNCALLASRLGRRVLNSDPLASWLLVDV